MKQGKKHQELAYYATSLIISWNWRSKRICRSIFKTKETRCIWNKHMNFIKNRDKQWSHVLSIQRAWYSLVTLVINFSLAFLSFLWKEIRHCTFDSQFRYKIPFSKKQYERPDTIWKCHQVAFLLLIPLCRKLSYTRQRCESYLRSSTFISHFLLPAEGPSPSVWHYHLLHELL